MNNVRFVEDGLVTWYVAVDICKIIGIKKARNAVANLDDDEKTMVTIDGKKYRAINEAGVYSLIFCSSKDYAKKTKRWLAHDVLPAISKKGSYDIALDGIEERLNKLTERLEESGIVKPFVNPRYTFDNLKNRYRAKVAGATARDFYDALGDWVGIKVPPSRALNITVKEWLLENIPIEVMNEFVIGVESDTIVRNDEGFWISLNGVFGNTVEWEKIKKSFGHRCAYCGCNDKPLIAEHINAQSEVSKEHPERVDLIENIIPTCAECNTNKDTNHWKTWFKSQPFYNEERYWRIYEHINKYKL